MLSKDNKVLPVGIELASQSPGNSILADPAYAKVLAELERWPELNLLINCWSQLSQDVRSQIQTIATQKLNNRE